MYARHGAAVSLFGFWQHKKSLRAIQVYRMASGTILRLHPVRSNRALPPGPPRKKQIPSRGHAFWLFLRCFNRCLGTCEPWLFRISVGVTLIQTPRRCCSFLFLPMRSAPAVSIARLGAGFRVLPPGTSGTLFLIFLESRLSSGQASLQLLSHTSSPKGPSGFLPLPSCSAAEQSYLKLSTSLVL